MNVDYSYESLISRLKKRDISAQEIESIARTNFISQYKVQKEILFNPKTPLKIGIQFVSHLFYKDLEKLAADPYVSHILKNKAEHLLVTRYESLTLGEKSELSRLTKNKKLFYLLLSEQDELLWENTLSNPHLLEKELVIFIRTRLKSSRLAEYISDQKRWKKNYSILRSLAFNSYTPLSLLGKMGYEMLLGDFIEIFEEDMVRTESKAVLWNIYKDRIGGLLEHQKLLLCEASNKWILNALIEQREIKLMKKLVSNRKLTKNQLRIIRNHLEEIKGSHADKEEILSCIGEKLTKK